MTKINFGTCTLTKLAKKGKLKMTNYEKKFEIEKKVLAHAEKITNAKFKYAHAFGMAWVMLNDEQVQYLADFIERMEKENV